MIWLNASLDNHKLFPVAELFQYLLQLFLDLFLKNPKPILRYPDKMVFALIYNMGTLQIPFHASILRMSRSFVEVERTRVALS
jgi:hypothetical protein